MAHTTKVIGTRQLSDGQVSIGIQCCGNAQQTSWMTLDYAIFADDVKLAAALDAHHDKVAKDHMAAKDGNAKAQALLGSEKQH